MKVIVTGGAGFIGSHVTEQLARSGHEVLVIDDLNDFYAPAQKERNLAAAQNAGRVSFLRSDICDEGKIGEAFQSFAPDAVIHLAARAGVRPSLEQPVLYSHVNVTGTTVLFEASRRAGVKKFVFASSSSIYGIANRVPFSEEDNLNQPISPYAATKIAGEKIGFTYSHLYGMRVICLRFFTVYGPRQRPDLAIRKFIERIDAGRPVTLFGDGSSGRDYTFVSDTVSGIVAALDYDAAFEVFNLGNSSPVTLLEMVRTIEDATGKKAQIEWQPDQPGDVPITFADIGKAQRLLGYQPRTPFGEGIRAFVEWHRAGQ